MKKAILFCIVVLCCSCAILIPQPPVIRWPEKITYMEAICDIEMDWKDMRYSGSMSLRMKYPSALSLEIYGPFGNTLVAVKREAGRFSFHGGDEKITEEALFEEKYGLNLGRIMDDLAGRAGVHRDAYRVTDTRFDGGSNKICWEAEEGSICIVFLEVRFTE